MHKKRVYVDMVADLFHRGHVEFLKSAKKSFKNVYLIVGIHSDSDVASYKRQPIFSMEDRVEIVSACRYVDKVISNAPLKVNEKFLEKWSIDMVVHGDDMCIETLSNFYPGPVAKNKIKTVPYYPSISTTDIINRIKCQKK